MVLQFLESDESCLVLLADVFYVRIEIQRHSPIKPVLVLYLVECLCSLVEVLAGKQAVTFLEEIFGLVLLVEFGILHALVPSKGVFVLLVAVIDICHGKRSLVDVVAFGMTDGKIVELVLGITVEHMHRTHCEVESGIVAVLRIVDVGAVHYLEKFILRRHIHSLVVQVLGLAIGIFRASVFHGLLRRGGKGRTQDKKQNCYVP